MISYKTSVLEPALTVLTHSSIFGCLLYHKETRVPNGFSYALQLLMYLGLATKGLNCYRICFSCFVQRCIFSPLCSTACKCNGHASVCNTNTGKCFCTTKGIKGDECQLWVRFTLLFEIKRPCTYRHGMPTFFNDCIYDVSAHLFPPTVD